MSTLPGKSAQSQAQLPVSVPGYVTLNNLTTLAVEQRSDDQWWLRFTSDWYSANTRGQMPLFAKGEAQATLRKWAAADEMLAALRRIANYDRTDPDAVHYMAGEAASILARIEGGGE